MDWDQDQAASSKLCLNRREVLRKINIGLAALSGIILCADKSSAAQIGGTALKSDVLSGEPAVIINNVSGCLLEAAAGTVGSGRTVKLNGRSATPSHYWRITAAGADSCTLYSLCCSAISFCATGSRGWSTCMPGSR
jgi:hypothetical protein